ncbi:MAG: hypothetical protein QM661_13090 [Solimonas sp.]
MSLPRRLLPTLGLLAVPLFTACQSELSADLAVSAPTGASKVVLNVTKVDLEKESGSVTEYSTGIDDAFDLLPYSQDEDYNDDDSYEGRLELIDKDSVTGDFVGIRPVFDATDSYVQLTSGTQVPISISSQADYAAISLSLSNNDTSGSDSEDIVITLELPFSLVESSDSSEYEFTPVIRAVKKDKSGSISGTIPESSVTSGSCNSSAGSGVAVYVYSGSGVTPVDYYDDGSSANSYQPLASSLLTYDSSDSEYIFKIRYLPPGDYTVAWTCDAASDVPNTSDSLTFIDSEDVTVTAGSTSSVTFD